LFHHLCTRGGLQPRAERAHTDRRQPACAFLIVIVPLFYFLSVILVVLFLLLRFAGPR
jgi:hypothetical protein